jgi:tetratricopeptide (TPR) repeat protein
LPELEPRQPDVTEELSGSGETTTRQFFDPGLLKAYSRFNARAGLAALEAGEGLGAVYRARLQTLAGETAAAAAAPTQLDEAALPGLLFGNFPTLADVAPEGQGLIAQFLKDAGPLPTGESDGSDTRKVVQLAQSYRDAANKVVKELATGEGATAVAGLKLVERDISLAVMARARLYREQGRLAEALFLFEHVLDKDNVQVNYLNDPILFLELTRTYVMIGRHREALNYLAKLTQARPELWSIQEAIGNLSVLGTVDQAGRTGQQD